MWEDGYLQPLGEGERERGGGEKESHTAYMCGFLRYQVSIKTITVLLFFDSKLWWLLALVVSFSPRSTAGLLIRKMVLGMKKLKAKHNSFLLVDIRIHVSQR